MWHTVDDGEKEMILKQLQKEIPNDHLLINDLHKLELVLRRYDMDDTLFYNNQTRGVYRIHLTWQNKRSADKNYPRAFSFNSFQDWVERELIEDQKNWFGIA